MSQAPPLTDAEKAMLERIVAAPVPVLEVNMHIRDRLWHERLVDYVDLKSPFKSHAGREIPHLKAMPAARAKLGLPPETKAKKGRKK